MPQPHLSIVIPAYNEELGILRTLGQVISFLTSQSYSWEVVVVDDGSTDSTAALVGQFASRHSNVRLICVQHRGKGWAVKHGMLDATGTYRFLCDADLSMPIEQLERFLPPRLTEFDIAVLREARARLNELKAMEPATARRVGADGLLSRIDESDARKLLGIARWYN
ncbi:MAG: glycosyltransferase, partial [Chloroflexi bacterium]|nr:glycosyltransferase [Chloroflexota bacterium]